MATYDLRNNIPSASQIAAGDILNAPYNGSTFSLTLPKGIYTLEVWGCASVPPQAELDAGYSYQQGGYAKGALTLYANTAAYLLPGCGHSGGTRINGGNRWGGDASDIRLLSNSLYNRIIVAGGAGATDFTGSLLGQGGVGGGTTGGDGTAYYDPYPTVGAGGGGGTQTAGGAGNSPSTAYGKNGTFGAGGAYGGGGGWYGGGGGGQFYDAGTGVTLYGGGGGGSGFVLTSSSVSNVPSGYAPALKNSTYYLTSTQLVSGNSSSRPATPYPHASDGDGYVRITVTSITPTLPAPSNLTYSNLFENSVKLSWTASSVSGVTYAVYRGNTSIGTTTSTTFTDSGISPGNTYTYKVYATRSGYTDSSQITVSVTNPPKLGTPTAKTTTYTESATTISWNAVTNATGYTIYRGTTKLKSGYTSTSYTDTGAGAGKSYTYYVSATASGYYESAQRSIEATNKPKLATPSLSASYTLTSTTISWSAISGTSVKYKVWRGSTYIGEQTTTSYVDSSAGAGTSYTYKVTAIGTNAYDSNQASINASNSAQLATPTAKTTTYSETSTTISWNAVTNAAAYKVYRGSTLLTSTLTTTSYTDTSAGAGTSYTYKVSATASGYYESGQRSISTSNPAKLNTPSGLSYSSTVSSTTITWNAVTNATAYRIYRGSTLVASANTTTSFTDTSSAAGAGKTNTYYVSATASGYYESAQASITTTNKPQFATPTGLTVTYTQSSTKITWNKVTSPAAVTVYNVWRGSTSLGTVTSSASTISYTDSSSYGASGKSNTYYVSAAGTNSYYESSKASIKTSNPATLATPTNLKASYTQSATTLSWNAVTSATSYKVYRASTLAATITGTTYTDFAASSGYGFTYKIIASNSPTYYDSAEASITTSNPQTTPNIASISASQTANSVTLTWSRPSGATSYTVQRGNETPVTVTSSASTVTYTDNTIQAGQTYTYTVIAKTSGKYDSSAYSQSVSVYPRLPTPTLTEASQTQTGVTLDILRDSTSGVVHLLRDGVEIATFTDHQRQYQYTDSGLESKKEYIYTAYAASETDDYYDSLITTLAVYVGRDYTLIERQRNYLAALKRPFFKLCRLRFLYPNGTTAFALDNNPRNWRSKAFIADGTVNANMQNGQRLTASVTIANANHDFDFNLNHIWFGQDIALDEGLLLPNGEEYWRQTGVFIIDNPEESVNPNTRTVTYNLVDKWADLDGTLDGNLEGTYEVPVGTNIYTPVAALLTEDRGNGRPIDNVTPVFTEYFNSKTQGLPDGTTVSMVLSPYTLTIDGDGGTIGEVVLGLGGMVNAWVGYDNTGRLRIEPSQDDILDAQKAVLYRFTEEEVTLLGLAYTVKKEDLYNDYIIVGEQMDDYYQPGGRAQNLDPRSDTNVYIIGRKTKRESASGYATVQQCKDLAEWRLKRSGILQKAVNISCSQMFHIELNSLVEITRTDKDGSPTERHLIQGYSRPLAHNGNMTISAVSVNDYPIATVTEWPPA